MQTIADKAGVSKMTVSRALNNDYRISPATRKRILQIAATMGYRRSPLVSALMTQIRSGARKSDALPLAHVHNWPAEVELTPNLNIFRESARERARGLGFRLDSFHISGEGMTQQRLGQIFRSRGIRGILLEHLWDSPVEVTIPTQDFAMVAIGHSESKPAHHIVDSDQHAEILMLTEHLTRLGYKRIALINKEAVEFFNDYRRRAGFLLFQQSLPVKRRLPMILNCPSVSDLVDLLPAYLERHQPDVIVSQHATVFQKLLQLGFNVPGTIGFAHLGWLPNNPAFAGIDPNWKEKGSIAIERIVDQLNRNQLGPPQMPVRIVVPSSICQGKTLRYGEHAKDVETIGRPSQ